jgi:hypothetical protein
MPKLRRFRPKQHGGVKVSFLQPDGSYVATDVDLDIINAIFQYCIVMYLISASSASGIVFGATLPNAPLPSAPILLRANQLNEDGTYRSQDQVANRQRFVNEGLIVPECCLKISFVQTPSSVAGSVTVGVHVKRTCKRPDLEQEARVQSEIFRSTLCGTSAPLTFTPDKIAAITMLPVDFSTIVEALATRNNPPNPPPPTRVADAIVMLRRIAHTARVENLHIHIFVMELLKGETLRTFLAKPNFLGLQLQQQAKTDACNNVAISVIMTFLKSLYWSRDQHADNVMISGANTFTLDYGLMYHLLRGESYIKSLLESLLTSASIDLIIVAKYFGVFQAGITTRPIARTEVRRVFYRLYNMLKNPNLKDQLKIDPAADMATEIERISGIVFQMLSFFLLVDGLSNRYIHNTPHFQSTEYMERVFTRPVLLSFHDFLQGCRINLSAVFAVGSSVHQNMAYIVRELQPALAICPISGPARIVDEIPLNAAFPGSPGEVAHVAIQAARQAAIQAAIDQAALKQAEAEEEARRLSELEAERKAAAEAAAEAVRKKESAAAVAAAEATMKKKNRSAAAAHYDDHGRRDLSPTRGRSRSNSNGRPPLPPHAAAAAAAAPPPAVAPEAAAAVQPPGTLSMFKTAVTKWWWPETDPNRGGGTVKRRFRVQKRQKQTMRRPCNIRRQRRTHAVCRRRRNKNKTH